VKSLIPGKYLQNLKQSWRQSFWTKKQSLSLNRPPLA